MAKMTVEMAQFLFEDVQSSFNAVRRDLEQLQCSIYKAQTRLNDAERMLQRIKEESDKSKKEEND